MENILIPQEIPDKENQLVLRRINPPNNQVILQNNFPESSAKFIQEYSSSPGLFKTIRIYNKTRK